MEIGKYKSGFLLECPGHKVIFDDFSMQKRQILLLKKADVVAEFDTEFKGFELLKAKLQAIELSEELT